MQNNNFLSVLLLKAVSYSHTVCISTGVELHVSSIQMLRGKYPDPNRPTLLETNSWKAGK